MLELIGFFSEVTPLCIATKLRKIHFEIYCEDIFLSAVFYYFTFPFNLFVPIVPFGGNHVRAIKPYQGKI